MKRILALLSLAACCAAHATDPVVSNLTAAQRPGTKLVDIGYDVSADTPTVGITLRISSDGGASYTVPAVTLSGDVGATVATGTGKVITWDAGADWNQQASSNLRFEVLASHAGMALIPAGQFVMGDSLDGAIDAPPVTVNVSTFHIGRYEVTKALWGEVRNWALSNCYTDLAVGGGKASDHPVQTVNWWEVVKWCNARSEKEGLQPVYRVNGSHFVIAKGTNDFILYAFYQKYTAHDYTVALLNPS